MKTYLTKSLTAMLALLLLFSLGSCTKDTIGDADPSSNQASKTESAVSSAIAQNDQDESSSKPESAVSSTAVKIGVKSISVSKKSVTLMQGSTDKPTATIAPSNATNKSTTWSSSNKSIATVSSSGKITAVSAGTCTITVRSADNSNACAEISVTVTPLVEPELTYIDGILIANKTYALPSTYNPGVDPVANAALQEMFAAAKADGINLRVVSGFRSYTTQKNLYDKYVKRDGVAAADRYSARAGHSEHQTGLAFDINNASSSFIGTAEAKWLAENSYKYGFIIRYPEGKESITGYKYEPWHVRYLGVDIATAVYNSGLCLEEYLNITSVYQS